MAVHHHLGEGTPGARLRIGTTERDGWVVVTMEGELTFMGSTGIRALIDAAGDALGRGLSFRTLPGDGPARRIIDPLGVGERLGAVALPG